MDRAEEPGDVESAGQIGEGGPLCHQHDPAVPYGFELGPTHHGWSWRIGRLDDDLIVTGLAEDQEPAVTKNRKRRQRRIGEPRPLSRQGTSFEAEPLCATQHLRDADRRRPKLMTDLLKLDP